MRLEKVKIPRVWADEYFYESEIIPVTGIVPPLGVTLTPDTIITGDATVAVASCTFIGLGLVQVEYIVQEELTVETPGEDSFPLEYTFRFTRDYQFQKFFVPGDVLGFLYCEVFRFVGTVTITDIVVNEVANTLSFNNTVSLQTKLKALEDIQEFVALGTLPNVFTFPVTVVTAD
ncbi:MAG: hypothetical protein QM451_06135 [Bacillota bacterium]|jgi:hypothetical protein|nr:hypothetical protein [Bacillota bacterium]HHT90886.1 hypothetical protein [Bacillota bacterium]